MKGDDSGDLEEKLNKTQTEFSALQSDYKALQREHSRLKIELENQAREVV